MLTSERHQLILQMIKEQGVVKIQELVDATQASESTIRRDLTVLEEEKLLKRVHGGAAKLHGMIIEQSMPEKYSQNLDGKQKIAKYAASLVEAGDCIYLDAGSTVKEMIEYLPEKDLVVVTNGLMHVEQLLDKGIRVYVIGGYAKAATRALAGGSALASLEQYHFDKCFLGANGIHPIHGFTTPDPEEAVVKKKALSISRETFFLADHTKFGEISFANITDLKKITIITDELDEDIVDLYKDKTTVKVVSA
ncbi:DeoR/GlpR family DNA-binding transcription regulator [Sporosarcina sp. NPDC096371]|uniref:DeoR/GlpR family DNA-binding transcription regulator n=1 Tax=Sporosarcina sp. NPDC096371 TaxID=3364530 RepID=UPI0038272697